MREVDGVEITNEVANARMAALCLHRQTNTIYGHVKRKRPDPKAQPKSLDVQQGIQKHRMKYGVTLPLGSN